MRAAGEKTMLRFHQEWLADVDERERRRVHAVMARVEAALS